MTTVLVPEGALVAGARVALPSTEEHHLRVRRTPAGARVRLLDGAGGIGLGALVQVGPHWEVEVESTRTVPRPAPLLVAAGAGDRERFGWLVEKATELGASAIVAVETRRSRSVGGRVRADLMGRFQRRALESLKQCGGAWVPEVVGPVSLPEALTLGEPGGRWIASAMSERTPPAPTAGALAVLVGPEGGFDPSEHDLALAAGWTPVRLARTTLRFETAALAALALAAAARAATPTEEPS